MFCKHEWKLANTLFIESPFMQLMKSKKLAKSLMPGDFPYWMYDQITVTIVWCTKCGKLKVIRAKS